MGLATNGEWTGSYGGSNLDGLDVWDAIVNNEASPRSLIMHYVNTDGEFSIQEGNWKVSGVQHTLIEYNTVISYVIVCI